MLREVFWSVGVWYVCGLAVVVVVLLGCGPLEEWEERAWGLRMYLEVERIGGRMWMGLMRSSC